MRRASLGCATVGDGLPCYVIAELGINHNGDVAIAKKLIDVAAEAGADAVKLQKRTIEVVYTQEFLDSPRESPWGTTQREQKEALEFDEAEWKELAEYSSQVGLPLTASCWDAQAVKDVCTWIDPPWLKVASTAVTDEGLLWEYGSTGKPVVMSTCFSTLDEIDGAVRAISYKHARQGVTESSLVLLHGCGAYPAPDDELNLRAIRTLSDRYNAPVGYSGHERGVATTVAAVMHGACVVERHVTLDRSMYGSDQAASLEPEGLRRVIRDIRTAESALGDGVKRVMPSEEPVRRKLRGA